MRSLVLACLVAILVAPFARADDPTSQSTAPAKTSKSDDQSGRPKEPLASQFEQIRAEFEARQFDFRQAVSNVGDLHEKRKAVRKKPPPDMVVYCRRMVDLA